MQEQPDGSQFAARRPIRMQVLEFLVHFGWWIEFQLIWDISVE